MGGITSALQSASSGLLVNQKALGFLSQNIANANTEGYSRRIITQKSVTLNGVPAGVRLGEINRAIDNNLLKRVRDEMSELNFLTSKSPFFDRLQEAFGSPGNNTSLSHILEKFQNSAELLSATPNRSVEQGNFVRQAENVFKNLRDLSNLAQDLRLRADQDITNLVTELNRLVQDVDQSNDDIISIRSIGSDTSELEDARDNSLDRIAEILEIQTFSRNDGDVVVFTKSGKTLVDTIPPAITHTAAAVITPTATVSGGEIDGIFVGPRANLSNDITADLNRGGILGGLVDIRDNVLPNLQSQLDELAAELQTTINQVHNRGVAFPGYQSFEGTRVFNLNSTANITPQFSIDANDDTVFVLLDGAGNQQSEIRLSEILTGRSGTTTLGDGTNAGNGPITIVEFGARLEDYLQASGAPQAAARLTDDGRFNINLSQPNLNLAIRDEAGRTPGGAHEDAVISFDPNGDTFIDETINGFSSFLGLNDLVVDNLAPNSFDSQLLSPGFTTTAGTLTFFTNDGFLGADTPAPSTAFDASATPLTVPAGTSLTELASLITDNIPQVTAAIIHEASGVRLRVKHDEGSALTITQAAGQTFLGNLALEPARSGRASALSIRNDIVANPGKVARGQVRFDSAIGAAGQYRVSSADNANIEALADTLESANSFEAAGGLPNLNLNFADFGAAVVGRSSSLAQANETAETSQKTLTNALQFQSDNIRGVNVDEELANLIVLEQAYSAAARVLSVIQDLIDELTRSVL